VIKYYIKKEIRMNGRERWKRIFKFEKVDRVFNCEFGYWTETLKRWHNEGLPEDIDNDWKADKFFNFDPIGGIPVNMGLIPHFEEKIIEETDRYIIKQGTDGIINKIFKDGTSTIPHYIKFPVENKNDWIEFKERLKPDISKRYPDEETWKGFKKEWEKRDYPLGISCGSLFGWIRNWMGFENCLISIYEQPDLIEDMMDYIVYFVLTLIEKALQEVKNIDFALFWEDMAFKTGPMISPKHFSKLMVPRYKKITDRLKKEGIDVVIVDCDGNINELVPLWLEAGVNVMFPLEINSGSDPVVLRKKYGNKVLLKGGVDKKALIYGKEAIDRELERIKETVESGGFIPHVDHRVPADVSYENYKYYLKKKKKIFNISDWNIEEILK
jgi:uroporphyrinogen decarboxylase